jgi:hypothetical protein
MKKSDINPMPPNFAKFINLVADFELFEAFAESIRQMDKIDKNLFQKLDGKRYVANKWTVKDILQHLADSDRIMSYQALMLARKDDSVLQGFNEKLQVDNASADSRTIDELIEDMKVARKGTIEMFKSFDREMLLSKATKWTYEISALAMGFTIIGHQIHHLQIIAERYYPLVEKKL